MGGVIETATVVEDELVARAYLSRVAEPASRAVWEFVRDHGPLEAADRIRAGSPGAANPDVLAATAARRDVADVPPISTPHAGTGSGWWCPSIRTGRTSQPVHWSGR